MKTFKQFTESRHKNTIPKPMPSPKEFAKQAMLKHARLMERLKDA